jgi:hypothetical protein
MNHFDNFKRKEHGDDNSIGTDRARHGTGHDVWLLGRLLKNT